MRLNACVVGLLEPGVLQTARDPSPHLFGFEPGSHLVFFEGRMPAGPPAASQPSPKLKCCFDHMDSSQSFAST